MVLILTKKIKGHDYYYLVKNQWDPVKKKSTQQIIKYIRNVKNFNIKIFQKSTETIPE